MIGRAEPRLLLAGALALALAGGAATILPARQPDLQEQRERLTNAKREAEEARARSAAAARSAAIERNAAAQARAELAALSERVTAAEADVEAAQARIAILNMRLAHARAALARQRAPVSRAVAALQSMARRPAFLNLAQPGSARDMVHVRAMLQTITPAIAARTEGAQAEIAQARTLAAEAMAAVAALRMNRETLATEQRALAQAEAQHRTRGEALAEQAMDEGDRAIAFGERARTLSTGLARTRNEEALRDELAALPGPDPRANANSKANAQSDRRGRYMLPVRGTLVTGFGEISPAGVRSRGLTLAVAPGARIIAPAAGTIRYAGRFRTFGTIMILDHGGGWTTLITGLKQTRHQRGDKVRQNELIGNAPDSAAPPITIELRHNGKPVDMTALLR